MPIVNSSERDLIIIGNGFDEANDLSSSFKDYLNIDNYSCYRINSLFNAIDDNDYGKQKKSELTNLRKRYPEYFCLIDFLYKYNLFSGYIYDKIDAILSDKSYSRNIKLKPFILNGNSYKITPNQISYNYLVLKLANIHYELKINSFDIKNINENDKSLLRKDLQNLNEVGNKYIEKLKELAKGIKTSSLSKGSDFWEIILLYAKYFDAKKNYKVPPRIGMSKESLRKWYNSYDHIDNWSDVEDMIKKFIVSVYNFPIAMDLHNRIYSYNNIWEYFPESDMYSSDCFNIFTYINRYLDLIANLLNYGYSYNDFYNIFNDILNSKYFDFAFNHPLNNNYSTKVINNIKDTQKMLSTDSYHISKAIIFVMLSLGYDPAFNETDHAHLFDYLHSQLNLFRKRFSRYLNNRISNSKAYLNKSSNLLSKLTIASDLKSFTGNPSILDFNYTPINSNIKHVKHIHGTLRNGDIVIGVGEQEINRLRNEIENDRFSDEYYRQLYSFTKTHELPFVHYKYDPTFLKGINNIVFFGHSLGVNDYQYFEALFDHFNLYYNTNINLIFCYSAYGNETVIQAKDNMVNKVIYLLKQYCSSLNLPHEHNFIVRAFLENSRVKFHNVNEN